LGKPANVLPDQERGERNYVGYKGSGISLKKRGKKGTPRESQSSVRLHTPRKTGKKGPKVSLTTRGRITEVYARRREKIGQGLSAVRESSSAAGSGERSWSGAYPTVRGEGKWKV